MRKSGINNLHFQSKLFSELFLYVYSSLRGVAQLASALALGSILGCFATDCNH